jgi:hypothetical protein
MMGGFDEARRRLDGARVSGAHRGRASRLAPRLPKRHLQRGHLPPDYATTKPGGSGPRPTLAHATRVLVSDG